MYCLTPNLSHVFQELLSVDLFVLGNLPADSLVLRLLKNPNQTVFSLEFEGRVSLA